MSDWMLDAEVLGRVHVMHGSGVADLSDGVQSFLKVLGAPWPEGNGDRMYSMRDSWDASVRWLEDLLALVKELSPEVAAGLVGELGNFFEGWLREDAVSGLQGLIAAGRELSKMLKRGAADTVKGQAEMVLMTLMALAAIASLLSSLWGAFFVPLVEAAARLGLWALFRELLAKLGSMSAEAALAGASNAVKVGAKATVTDLGSVTWGGVRDAALAAGKTALKFGAVGAGLMGGMDLGIEVGQVALNLRDEVDVKSALLAAVGGFVGGAAGGLFHAVALDMAEVGRKAVTAATEGAAGRKAVGGEAVGGKASDEKVPRYVSAVGDVLYGGGQVGVAIASAPLVNLVTNSPGALTAGVLGALSRFGGGRHGGSESTGGDRATLDAAFAAVDQVRPIPLISGEAKGSEKAGAGGGVKSGAFGSVEGVEAPPPYSVVPEVEQAGDVVPLSYEDSQAVVVGGRELGTMFGQAGADRTPLAAAAGAAEPLTASGALENATTTGVGQAGYASSPSDGSTAAVRPSEHVLGRRSGTVSSKAVIGGLDSPPSYSSNVLPGRTAMASVPVGSGKTGGALFPVEPQATAPSVGIPIFAGEAGPVDSGAASPQALEQFPSEPSQQAHGDVGVPDHTATVPGRVPVEGDVGAIEGHTAGGSDVVAGSGAERPRGYVRRMTAPFSSEHEPREFTTVSIRSTGDEGGPGETRRPLNLPVESPVFTHGSLAGEEKTDQLNTSAHRHRSTGSYSGTAPLGEDVPDSVTAIAAEVLGSPPVVGGSESTVLVLPHNAGVAFVDPRYTPNITQAFRNHGAGTFAVAAHHRANAFQLPDNSGRDIPHTYTEFAGTLAGLPASLVTWSAVTDVVLYACDLTPHSMTAIQHAVTSIPVLSHITVAARHLHGQTRIHLDGSTAHGTTLPPAPPGALSLGFDDSGYPSDAHEFAQYAEGISTLSPRPPVDVLHDLNDLLETNPGAIGGWLATEATSARDRLRSNVDQSSDAHPIKSHYEILQNHLMVPVASPTPGAFVFAPATPRGNVDLADLSVVMEDLVSRGHVYAAESMAHFLLRNDRRNPGVNVPRKKYYTHGAALDDAPRFGGIHRIRIDSNPKSNWKSFYSLLGKKSWPGAEERRVFIHSVLTLALERSPYAHQETDALKLLQDRLPDIVAAYKEDDWHRAVSKANAIVAHQRIEPYIEIMSGAPPRISEDKNIRWYAVNADVKYGAGIVEQFVAAAYLDFGNEAASVAARVFTDSLDLTPKTTRSRVVHVIDESQRKLQRYLNTVRLAAADVADFVAGDLGKRIIAESNRSYGDTNIRELQAVLYGQPSGGHKNRHAPMLDHGAAKRWLGQLSADIGQESGRGGWILDTEHIKAATDEFLDAFSLPADSHFATADLKPLRSVLSFFLDADKRSEAIFVAALFTEINRMKASSSGSSEVAASATVVPSIQESVSKSAAIADGGSGLSSSDSGGPSPAGLTAGYRGGAGGSVAEQTLEHFLSGDSGAVEGHTAAGQNVAASFDVKHPDS
ncbi:hypothetical protein [Amycolatopsis sp. WQ 127309]|uniref:hypothetical protein n=1 Tax=Amycolatopsis sp. WQ 127309 TaxID=2932773 RepID=UPI001FF40E9D|nr:hypothetical protein [Amycolatopsis sp. WQ 127309]UOZ07017.1 hypothetical protein MUY22_01610 [Amycolatopsis sp. WQ 127309]